jgi:hypothetical protein
MGYRYDELAEALDKPSPDGGPGSRAEISLPTRSASTPTLPVLGSPGITRVSGPTQPTNPRWPCRVELMRGSSTETNRFQRLRRGLIAVTSHSSPSRALWDYVRSTRLSLKDDDRGRETWKGRSRDNHTSGGQIPVLSVLPPPPPRQRPRRCPRMPAASSSWCTSLRSQESYASELLDPQADERLPAPA